MLNKHVDRLWWCKTYHISDTALPSFSVPLRPRPHHAGQHLRHSLVAEGVEPAVFQVAQPGREPEAEQREQAEHLAGGAPGIGVMLDDAQFRAILITRWRL